MVDTRIANERNYNPFSSWVIITCDNGRQALFGNKKDFGNKKVSGFGGFSTLDDIYDDYIDVEKWMMRKLLEEFGKIGSVIKDVKMVGLGFYPILPAKGFDGIYVAELDGKPEELEMLFRESPQFSRNLIPVSTDPQGLVSLLEDDYWEPTNSCIGGVLTYIGSRYGREELVNCLLKYSRRNNIRVFEQPITGVVRESVLRSY